MTDYEYHKLRAWLSVLKDVVREYKGRTLDNIIDNVQARVDHEKKRREKQ